MTTRELDFSANIMLCDSVVAAEGKLYIQGAGWDMMRPPVYPVRLPRIGIAAAISVPYTRTNQNHSLVLRLKSEDGSDVAIGMQPDDPANPVSTGVKPLYTIEGNFNMGRPPLLQGGDAQLFPFACNVDGLVIQEPGSYYFLIEIDTDEIARARFRALGQTPGFSR